jgi:hypothetical protein
METRWLIVAMIAAVSMGSSVRAEAQAGALSVPTPTTEHAEAGARSEGVQAPLTMPGHEFETTTPFSARLPRLGVMTLAGSAAAVGGGFALFEVGCAIGGGRDPSGFGDDMACGLWGMILGAVGVGVLTPLSVLATGWLMDGNGSAMWTAIGTVIGAAAGQIVAFALSTQGVAEAQVIPMMLGPVLGAVTSYELRSDPSREEVEQKLDGGIEWHTSLGPTEGGASIGVSGRF